MKDIVLPLEHIPSSNYSSFKVNLEKQNKLVVCESLLSLLGRDNVFGEAKLSQEHSMLGKPIFFRLIVISAMNL